MKNKEFAYAHPIRSRYGETDQMGFIYYGRFAEYYEVGRVETMRSLGLTYSELEHKNRILMPVISMHVRYLRPALYDQMLEIKTMLRKVPDDTITFFTEIRNEAGLLINAATVRLCFLDADTRQRVPCPTFLKELISYAIENTHHQ